MIGSRYVTRDSAGNKLPEGEDAAESFIQSKPEEGEDLDYAREGIPSGKEL